MSLLSSNQIPDMVAFTTAKYMKRATLALVLSLALLVAPGCDSALDTEPAQSIQASTALDTESGFESLLTSSYSRLLNVSYYMQQYAIEADVLADNMTITNQNTGRFLGSLQNTPGAHLTRYSEFYTAINEANLVISNIDNLDDVASVDQATKDRIEGEARFLRALNYHDLMRSHAYEPGRAVDGFTQGAILRTEPVDDVSEADFRARSSISEVYDQIETDLQQASSLLEGTTQPLYRANYTAAQALLARVYLYASEWGNAADAASNAIAAANDRGITLASDSAAYVNAYSVPTHPETIFEVNINTIQNDPNENLNLHTTQQMGFGGDFVATENLIDAHEDDDARLGLYVPGTKSGQNVTYVQKWQGDKGNETDNIPVIRISEMYLTLAEATGMSDGDDDSDGEEALNAVRSRVGLEDADDGISGDDLAEAAFQERRLELAFEGHRFLDLKRRGMDIPKPQPQVDADEVPYTDFRILAPLPQAEVDRNPELVQNPGY